MFCLFYYPQHNIVLLPSLKLRRLRVQQRIKSMKNDSPDEENEMPDIPSSIPFLPHVVTSELFCIIKQMTILLLKFNFHSLIYLFIVGFSFRAQVIAQYLKNNILSFSLFHLLFIIFLNILYSS